MEFYYVFYKINCVAYMKYSNIRMKMKFNDV